MDTGTRYRPHPNSLAAWLGVEEAESIHLARWVALDEWSVAYWDNATFGEAWELTCLHSRLDPYPLWALRVYLSMGRDYALDIQLGMAKRPPPPLLVRKHALHVNLGVVESAIARRELRTLPPAEGEEFDFFRPCMRRVAITEFRRWSAQVELPRTLAWPDRADEDQRSRSGRRQKADQLVLDVVNDSLRLLKEVREAFRGRYRAGGRQTPTRVEVERFLIEELGEPPNRKLAAAITKFLAPDTTPHGPRRRAR